jgi:hypothetical protein
MPESDDLEWLALLSGQAVPGAHPSTVREARALRAAILAEYEALEPSQVAPGAVDRVLLRLQRGGLLSRTAPAWWQHPTGWSLVAAGLVLAVLLPWSSPLHHSELSHRLPFAPAPVYKNFVLPQVLYAPEPQEHAMALQAALTACNLQVQRLTQGDHQLLIVQLPLPATTAVRDVLQHYRLSVPPDGRLRVEIVPGGG